jgi:hypothetical protein
VQLVIQVQDGDLLQILTMIEISLEYIPENIVGNGIVVMIAILIQTTTRISHA